MYNIIVENIIKVELIKLYNVYIKNYSNRLNQFGNNNNIK